MTIALVSSQTASASADAGGTTIAVAFPGNITSGNAITAAVGNSSGQFVSTVADGLGNNLRCKPVFVGANTATGNSADFAIDLTSLTGGIASSPAAGDLVLVGTAFVSTADGNPGVSTSGYTELCDLYANDNRDCNLSVNWKIMGATPDTSVTCLGSGSGTSGAAGIAYVWRYVDQTTPIDVTTTTATGTNSAVPNPPSITPTTGGAMLTVVGAGTGAATDTAVTVPTGFGNAAHATVDPGDAIVLNMCSKQWTGNGAEDPAAYTGWTTSTSDSWCAATVAIRPMFGVDYNSTTLTERLSIHAANNVTGGASTITATFNASTTFRRLGIAEFSGTDAGDPTTLFDGYGMVGQGTSTSAATTAKTPSANGALFLSWCNNSTVPTVGTDFTSLATYGSDSLYEYFVQSTAASHTGSAGISPSAGWGIVAVVLLPGSGAQTVSPSAANIQVAGITPTLVPGAITLSVAQADINVAAISPVLYSLNTLAVAQADVQVGAFDLGITVGPVSVSPASANINVAGITPTLVPGTIILTPASADIQVAGITPSIVIGAVSQIPTAADIQVAGQTPTLIAGVATLTFTSADIQVAGIDTTLATATPQTFTPSAADIQVGGITPALVLGNVALTFTAPVINVAGVDPTLVLGNVALTFASANVQVTANTPTLVLGNATLLFTAANINVSGIDPTLVGGGVIARIIFRPWDAHHPWDDYQE